MLDACSQLNPRPPIPDTGSIKSDLEQLVCRLAVRFREPWATVMPSIIDAAERDKDLAALQARIHAQMREAFVTVIERGQKRGELSQSQDAKELVAGILGPILYRRFFSREPLDEAFAKKVVARLLQSVRPPSH